MNQYLLIADYGNDMDRHLLNGEDELLSILEKSYMTGSADLEVFVLNGAVNPITTNVGELLDLARERQQRRTAVVSHLDNLTRDMSPKYVIVVSGANRDVAFGKTEVEAIQSFVETFVQANGETLSDDEALLVRKSLKVRQYHGSSYEPDDVSEVPGNDARFDDAFSGLSAKAMTLGR